MRVAGAVARSSGGRRVRMTVAVVAEAGGRREGVTGTRLGDRSVDRGRERKDEGDGEA